MSSPRGAYIFGGYVAAFTGAESAPGAAAGGGVNANATGSIVGGGFSRTLWECDPASPAFTCDDLTLGCPSKSYPGGMFLPRGLTARYGHRAVATASSMFIIGGAGEEDDDAEDDAEEEEEEVEVDGSGGGYSKF